VSATRFAAQGRDGRPSRRTSPGVPNVAAVLSVNKTDGDALEAKALALLEEGKVSERCAPTTHQIPDASLPPYSRPQWEDAVACCTTPATAVQLAYALYRSDDFDGALAITTPLAAGGNAAAQHVQAQVLFRVGRYDESAAMYDALLAGLEEAGDEADPAEVDEVRLNMAAAYVAAERARDLVSHPSFVDILEALRAGRGKAEKAGFVFELLYNVACALIDAGDPALAMRALSASYAVGYKELTEVEGMDPAAAAEDLAAITAQAGYLLQLARYDEAAASVYAQVLAMAPKDAVLNTVIQTNLAATRLDGGHVVAAYRRLKQLAGAPAATAKMLRRQIVSLHYNRAVLAFLLQRWEDVRAATAAVRAAASSRGSEGHPFIATVLAQVEVLELVTGVAAAAGGTTPAAVAALLPKLQAAAAAAGGASGAAATSTGGRAVSLPPAQAMRVHLLAAGGDVAAAAAEAVAAFPAGATPHPAAVATVVQLCAAAGQEEAGRAFLDRAVDAWLAAAPRPGGLGRKGAAPGVAANPARLPVPLPHDVASAIAVLHIRAGTALARGDTDAAIADLNAVAKLAGASAEEKGVALAAVATARARTGLKHTGDARKAALGDADVLLREATALAEGAGSRKPSFADLSRFNDAVIDKLEWTTTPTDLIPTSRKAASGTAAAAGAGAGTAAAPSTTLPASSRGAAVGGALASTAALAAGGAGDEVAATAALAAAHAAAVKAAAKRRQLRRRALRRLRYQTKLRATLVGPGGVIGLPATAPLPKPDPERWLPKRERAHGRKGKKKVAAKGGAFNVSSGGAQGVTAAGEALARDLDAKAKADAAKAKATVAGAGAGSPAPSPAGRGGKKRR